MTQRQLSNAVVIPQDPGTGIDTTDDAISAASASLLASHEQGSYVRKSDNSNSLSFANVDTSNNEVGVQAGVAYIVDESQATSNNRSANGNPQLQSTSTSGFDTEIPNRQPHCVIVPEDQLDLSLDSGVNDIFLEVKSNDQNNAILRFGTSVTPGANALKLGTIDTSDGSTTRPNDKPSPKYNALETEQLSITNEPFVAARPNSDISISAGSWVNVTLGDEVADPTNILNPSTGKITPDKTGIYEISGGIYFDGSAANDGLSVQLRNTTNGTTRFPRLGQTQNADGDNVKVPINGIGQLTAGDSYVVQVRNFDSSDNISFKETEVMIDWIEELN